jgi:hypothetical protein
MSADGADAGRERRSGNQIDDFGTIKDAVKRTDLIVFLSCGTVGHPLARLLLRVEL